MIICGILLGLAIGTKYTNILLVPLFIFIYFALSSSRDKKLNKLLNYKFLFLILISVITFFMIWPEPWFHLKEVLQWEKTIRFSPVASHPIPEVFFGKLILVPVFYYFVYFIITTPFLILLLFLIGLKKVSDERKKILYVFVVWFLLPFIQSFLNMRQHGIRYIIEIYAPLSLITAIGFDYLINFFKKKYFRVMFLALLIFYMILVLKKITPYYLDYFNILVGGTRGVYQDKSFQLGWWGQGVRQAALYLLNNAKDGSKIGIAISPITVMPNLKKFNVEEYKIGKVYDYIIVNYYNVLREGFDDSEIRFNYNVVYNVKASEATLVIVYKHK